MSYCKICGDESKPQGPFRFWSPDDGWVCGRLCPTCKQDHAKRKPRKEDFAYDKRGEYLADEQDAIDAMYG